MLGRTRPDRGAGRPKKNGCGGKYTWVGQKALQDLEADLGSGEVDAEDPNYDSEEEDLLLPRGHAEELQAYKQSVRLGVQVVGCGVATGLMLAARVAGDAGSLWVWVACLMSAGLMVESSLGITCSSFGCHLGRLLICWLKIRTARLAFAAWCMAALSCSHIVQLTCCQVQLPDAPEHVLALQVTALIEEYFNSGDHVEAAASLRVRSHSFLLDCCSHGRPVVANIQDL